MIASMKISIVSVSDARGEVASDVLVNYRRQCITGKLKFLVIILRHLNIKARGNSTCELDLAIRAFNGCILSTTICSRFYP